MTTTINISLNMPPNYGVERLTRQLTEYAQRLVWEDSVLQEGTDKIVLSQEMVSAAKQAEQDYRDGKCVGEDEFNKRFEKWL
ncbi:MAG: hypothetical protein IKS72_01415 [Prevotella sp.]|nr:hypothetical protein [Prevotella sp.]